MAKTKEIKLPQPTSATTKGPILHFENSSLILDYDYQHDDGLIEWTRLLFQETLSFEYRQATSCAAEHVVGFHEMKCFADSDWRDARIKRWKEEVGHQEWQNQQGGEGRFCHFRIYFDDAGCVDVLASSYEIRNHLRP